MAKAKVWDEALGGAGVPGCTYRLNALLFAILFSILCSCWVLGVGCWVLGWVLADEIDKHDHEQPWGLLIARSADPFSLLPFLANHRVVHE